MYDLIFPILFMLVSVFGEALILHYVYHHEIDWQDVTFNLNSGHIVLWLFRGLEVACYAWVVTHWSTGWIANWPASVIWIFALLVWDFGFYWLHRLHHQWGLLWAVHVIHHQGEHFNLSLAVRNSWYSSLTSIPFFLILAILGLPLSVFLTVSIIHYSIQFMNHNALTPRIRWLESILVMPYYHSIHHVNLAMYTSSNFGGSFIFWDKLFGTFISLLPEKPFTFGCGHVCHSTNPFWASNLPFMRYFKLTGAYKESAARYICSAFCLVSGTIGLFLLVVGYIFTYGYGYHAIELPQVVFFLLLTAGVIALGGLSEGRYWGIYSWLIVASLLSIAGIGYFSWVSPYWQVVPLLILIHGIAVLVGWRQEWVPAEPT